MARLRRTRRILKWVGVVLLLLVAVVWAVSYSPFVLCWVGTSGGVIFLRGRVLQPFADQRSAIVEPGVQFIGQSATPATDDISVPLWVLFLVVAVPTVYLWWCDRRRIPPGHCLNCGYNLTGNVSGVCPECGGRITDAEVPSDAQQSRSETDGVSTTRTPRRQEEAGITKTRKKENTKVERGGG